MGTNPIKVLLVGGNYNDFIIIRNFLSQTEGKDFDPAWVATYDAALNTMISNLHDVYLVNYRLDKRNGIELLREAVANDCKGPMIILTEQEDRKVVAEVIKTGAADYLVKAQIDAHQLERSIRNSINHSKKLVPLRESQQFLQSILDAMSAHIAILDDSGTIITVNRAWRHFAEAHNFGKGRYGVGMSYLKLCESAAGDFAGEEKAVARGVQEVIGHKRDEFCLEYPCHSPTERCWFIARVARFSGDGSAGVVVVHENITERKLIEETLNENLARLSKKNRYETVISSVTRSIHEYIDLHDVLENTVEIISKNIDGIDYASIYLIEGEEAVMKAHRGYPPWFIKRERRIPYPKGFTWKTIIEGKATYCADADRDTVISLAERALGTKSYVSIPICLRGNVVGCININSLQRNAFDEDDLKPLQIIAQQIEVMLHNAQVTEALRQSEERYRTLFEQSPVGVYIFDKQLKITQCNERLAEILGSSYEKIIGLDMQKLKDQSFVPAMKKVLEGQSSYHEGFYEATTGSAKLWISLSFSPLHDSDGNITGGMAVVEDITAHKLAEEALHNSEECYRVLYEENPSMYFTVDAEGTILSVNRFGAEQLGYTVEELAEQSILIVFHPDDQKAVLEQITGCLQNPGQIARWEIRKICKDKSIIWVKETARALLDTDGNAIVLIACEDITERKRIEEALATEKERLAVTLHSIGDGVITTDTEGKIVLVNPSAEKLTGWTQEEAVGRSLEEVFYIINEKTRECCKNPIEKVIKTGGIVGLARHTALLSKDGTERVVSASGAPIRNKDGNIIGGVLVFRDITERKRMEAEILKAQKLESIGIFAGGIAHNFNNLLTAILGNISSTKGYTDTESIIHQRLGEAEETCLQAKNLTHQLLTLSKGDVPIKKVTSIGGLIKGLTNFTLRGSNVTCEFQIDEDLLWPVEVDERQISQVIHNLVINAQEAMPEGGMIKVKAENAVIEKERDIPLKEGSYVKITIEDQGIGIPEEHLTKVFDPYFTTKQEGNGLGLAIAYSIIKNHDGYIGVESRPGAGTTFSIYLPATKKIISFEEEGIR